MDYKGKKQKILIHACCATCLCYPYYHLSEDFEADVYFYNPNLDSKDEFEKRLSDVKTFTKNTDALLFIGDYENKTWEEKIKGFENEPEGGKRCSMCFELRLEKTALLAKEKKYDFFTSTLAVSPHKNFNIIKKLSEEIAARLKINFFDENFRKKDGFKKTINLSKKSNFYMQNYCGCIYSMKEQQNSTTINNNSKPFI